MLLLRRNMVGANSSAGSSRDGKEREEAGDRGEDEDAKNRDKEDEAGKRRAETRGDRDVETAEKEGGGGGK